jgi:hypothetical protein
MKTGRRLDGVEFEVKLLQVKSGDCWDIQYPDGSIEEAVVVAELVVVKEKAAAPSTIV